jgi:hypothetical protein
MKVGEIIEEDWNAAVQEAVRDINDFSKGGRSRDEIRKKLQKTTQDKIIDEAFRLHDISVANLSGAHVLKDKKSKENMGWYKPTLEPDENSRWGKLKKVLENKGWPKPHIEDLDNQSNSVVSSIKAPNGDAGIVKGLVLGYVQSGKTANFSAAIAKACDEKYKIIIILAGTQNSLRAQTEKRLESELINPHQGRNSFRFTSTSDDGDFKKPESPANTYLSSEGKIIFLVLKKNTTVLRKFSDWIFQADKEILKHSPVLIIDDEADQASLNEAKKDKERTATNKLIVGLLDFFGKHAPTSYVGYTATPFANILLDAEDEQDLFPRDFIVALKAPETYVGTERLFGRVGLDGEVTQPLDLIRKIDVSETVDADDVKSVKFTASLERAICTFMLSGAERVRRAQSLNKPDIAQNITMLVHTSQLTEDHCLMTDEISNFKTLFVSKFGAGEKTQREYLKKIWESDFIKTSQKGGFSGIEIGTFDDVLPCLEIFLNELQVLEINSKSKEDISFTAPKTWAIIIGGSKLSRGLTIEGLTVSYFHRTSKGYDTLLQMGRWFGYRPNYLDLTRIFVTSEMEANFHHLATVEYELREDIERMVENGETPRDMALKVRDHNELEITLKRSIKNATISSSSFSAQKISSTLVKLDNVKWADHNAKAVKSLVADLEKGPFKDVPPYLEFRNCLLYKGVPPETILKFLKEYDIVSEDRKLNRNLLKDYIGKLALKEELTQWSVAVMSRLRHEDDKMIDLGVNGLKVTPVERRQSPRYSGDNFDRLKNVSIMSEELIDLGDFIQTPSIANYIKEKKLKPAIVRNDLRPKERGLLLIYPIYTNYDKTPEQRAQLTADAKLFPVISDAKELFAITLVFPSTKVDTFDCQYIQNATVGREAA